PSNSFAMTSILKSRRKRSGFARKCYRPTNANCGRQYHSEENMDNRKIFTTNGSSVWPYIIVGSAIGGAIGYLFKTEAGRENRRSVAHPHELAHNNAQARDFIERKTTVGSDPAHPFFGKGA